MYFTPHAGQPNEFDDAFKKVVDALDSDYEHSREHTRLLLRAIEWDKRQKNASYTLRGAEIEKAEGWQMAATSKDPSPTSLQSEYILSSRKIQRRQQQRFMGVIGVLLVLAALAAVFALIQAGEARRQEDIALGALADAQRNAEIAHSRSLAAAAYLPGNDEFAVALALEATRSENAPADVFKTLEQIAYQQGAIRYARVPAATESFPLVRYQVASPLGQYVIVGAQRYNLETGEADLTFKDVPGYPLAGVYLPDGKSVILVGDDEGYNDPTAQPVFMGLYDSETGELIRRFNTGIGVYDVQLSGDSETVISYLPNQKSVWWDIATGNKIKEFDTNGTATFSPDLKWLALVTHSEDGTTSELTVTEIDTNMIVVRRTLPPISAMRFSSDSSEFTISTDMIRTYKIPDWEEILPLDGSFQSIRYSADSSMMVTIQGSDVTVWSRFGVIIANFTSHDTQLLFADFVRGNQGIVSMDVFGTILEWDITPGNVVRTSSIATSTAMLSVDGHSLILTEECDIVTRDVETLVETARISVPMMSDDYCSLTVFVDPNGGEGRVFHNYFETDDQGEVLHGVIEVLSLTTGKSLQTWKIPNLLSVRKILLLPDSQRVVISYNVQAEDPNEASSSHYELRDIASGKLLQSYALPQGARLALSPDGTRLLYNVILYNEDRSTALTTIVAMLDVVTGEEKLRLNESS